MNDSILRNFRKIVTPEFISKTSFKFKFSQRSTSQLSGLDFVRMLIYHAGSGLEMTYSNLNATLNKINPEVNISNQALAKYFYKDAAVNLIRSIYEKILSIQKEKTLLSKLEIRPSILSLFNRILIQDSTICVLNEKLRSHYPGSGGSASKSSLKIDVIHDLKEATILKTFISAGNKPDATQTASILDELKARDLVLRDLGYSKLETFAQITEKSAYFISRYHPSLKVYLDNSKNTPIDLGDYLQRKCRDSNQIEMIVYLGHAKQRCRIICYRVPLEVSNERRRKVKRNAVCKKNGGTPSKAKLALCDFIILITNIPSEMLPAEVIGTIYRIRWSIELIFKTWKSLFKLELNLKGSKVRKIECIVYTILILAVLTMMVQSWMKKMGLEAIGQEISIDKLTKWLLNRQGYFRLFWESILELEESIKIDLRRIRGQKRKRKTTLERVVLNESYLTKFDNNFLIG